MPRTQKLRAHSDQLPLEFGAEFVSLYPVFFALMLTPSLAPAALAIGQDLNVRRALNGSLRPQTHLHMSLSALTSGDEQTIGQAKKAAASLEERSFTVFLNHAMGFHVQNKSALVLCGDEDGMKGVREFRNALNEALTRHGLRTGADRFTPHVTVLYSAKPIDREPIDMLSWTVREFSLIRSLWGETRYNHLGSWSLRE